MKVSDYVFAFLSEKGITQTFFLPGGGCMHLLNSMGRQQDMVSISLLHEQAAAIATESYAFTGGKPAALLVTTGPGATNAITGILAAYLDSIPCFVLSGQVKTTSPGTTARWTSVMPRAAAVSLPSGCQLERKFEKILHFG